MAVAPLAGEGRLTALAPDAPKVWNFYRSSVFEPIRFRYRIDYVAYDAGASYAAAGLTDWQIAEGPALTIATRSRTGARVIMSIPAISRLDQTLVYHDFADRQMIYLDVLRPAPVHGADIVRWQPIPPDFGLPESASSFGSRRRGLSETGRRVARHACAADAVGASPVYVWSRDGDGVRRFATGKTSGFGLSNAIFNATAPARAMIQPVQIAAELVCQARLAVDMRGGGTIGAIGVALERARSASAPIGRPPLARRCARSAAAARHRGYLTLAVQPGGLAAPAVAELREFALLEWAHRIATAQSPAIESLARPAAQDPRVCSCRPRSNCCSNGVRKRSFPCAPCLVDPTLNNSSQRGLWGVCLPNILSSPCADYARGRWRERCLEDLQPSKPPG